VRIFVGGGKTKHNDRFSKRYPTVVFSFAAEDDSPRVWVRRAQYCDYAIVLQHRTSHRHATCLKQNNVVVHFTDSIPIVHQIIKELLTYGKTGHNYAGPSGSESAAEGTATTE
jgi:hypothetical protein